MFFRSWWVTPLYLAVLMHLAVQADAQEEFIAELRNGMRIGPGLVWDTDSLAANAFQQASNSQGRKVIGVLDDGLRNTYYSNLPRNLLSIQKWNAPRSTQIELPSAEERARNGNTPNIRGIIALSNFNRFGRRTYSFATTRGQVDVVQGITLLTPKYAKIEVLRAEPDSFVWDQREAISSIPSDQLREILHQALDLSQSSEWLRLTAFYLEAERFGEARETVAEALRRFPTELADRAALLGQTEQLLANQLFDEIKLRARSGQHQFSMQLTDFPSQSLAIETQLKLEQEVDAVKQHVLQIAQVTSAIKEAVAKLPEPDQQVIAGVVQEMLDEVNFNSDARLGDFQRLRADDTIANENLVGLAIAGWVLGADAGVQNFAVAKSLLRVRGLVTEYLNSPTDARSQEILRILKTEEGAQPAFLDKLLETMKPPRKLPEQAEADPPGLHRLSINVGGDTVNYLVQLPPEYDPNRKYPCVLALPGRTEPPEIEVEWWCGVSVPSNFGLYRHGQATRYGYIVVSPDWMTKIQPEYQYTEGEHHRILAVLRDALRHTSIDTDRIYISGHFDGATAAWDLAQSHPELWAGAVMISPGADKHITHYYENLRAKDREGAEVPLGTYIVFGNKDGTYSESKVGNMATRYLTSPAYDSLVVEYQGRGRERFLSELPRIMEWMELTSHRRLRTPRNIETVTMRPGDRFYYWLEAPQILEDAAGNAFQFDPSKSGKFEANLLDSNFNGVSVASIPSMNRDAILWFSPDMVDFNRPITVQLRGDRSRHELTPDISIMLEDVRRRADRQHVFWQRLVVP
jgi:pimeloyl-ACP methyl ester carboxylesterase